MSGAGADHDHPLATIARVSLKNLEDWLVVVAWRRPPAKADLAASVPVKSAPLEQIVPNGMRKMVTGQMVSRTLAQKQKLGYSLRRINWQRTVQFLVVLLCAAGVKLYYSTASVNQLRWILAPTTRLVELVTGYQFEFESYAGYVKSDRMFVIAASCAGVNFLITAFLMLALRKLWLHRSQNQSAAWRFIPVAAVVAYVATLVANTVRISTALRMGRMPAAAAWLSPAQLHRFEGIFIYFGFLLLLFVLSERLGSESGPRRLSGSLLQRALFPLIIYYATTLGVPLVNGAYRSGTGTGDFWEHSVFVLVTPLLLMLPLATFRFCRQQFRNKRAVLSEPAERVPA